MIPEDSMRERLSAELEARRPPLGDLVGQAVAEGRRRKRRTRLAASALSAVGVLAVAGAAVQLAPGSPATSAAAPGAGTATGAPPGHQPTAATPAVKAPAPTVFPPAAGTTAAANPLTVAPIVKHVDPGTTTLDKGLYLNYTTDSLSWWEYEGGLTVQYNGTNTWGSDFLTMSGTDRLFTGFYVGDKDVAAAAVTIDGKQYPAVVVKVNGAHGWCGLYYLRPQGQAQVRSIVIDVYDSSGAVIAWTGAGDVPQLAALGSTGSGTLPITNIPLSTPFPGATVMVPPGANPDGSEPGKH